MATKDKQIKHVKNGKEILNTENTTDKMQKAILDNLIAEYNLVSDEIANLRKAIKKNKDVTDSPAHGKVRNPQVGMLESKIRLQITLGQKINTMLPKRKFTAEEKLAAGSLDEFRRKG